MSSGSPRERPEGSGDDGAGAPGGGADGRTEGSAAGDDALAQLVDEFFGRVRSGEALDAEAFALEHPEHAGALRDLLPAVEGLRELGGGDGGIGGARTRGSRHATDRIADFRIVREVGRGGMGIVYEAEQVSLGRRVALKVLPFASVLDERQVARFQNEARAAAQLHHANIVPVFAVGSERGLYYYAMQYVEGRTLAEVVRELRRDPRAPGLDDSPGPGPAAGGGSAGASAASAAAGSRRPSTIGRGLARAVARLGIQAAEALDFAHEAGILHRDVKPSNFLLDSVGKLWLTDFGLARVHGDAGLTLSGDVLGTLRYMSPEQALGKRGLVDQRTDIYSLGATLYELLTRRHAVEGEDREEILRRIAFSEPVAPRKLDGRIPVEMETVVLKAVAKRKEDRYETAGELAEDLRRFLDGRPILARRPSAVERAIKWTRRRPALAAIAALVALLIGTTLVLQYRHHLELEARYLAAAANERLATHREYAARQRAAYEAIREDELLHALTFLEDFAAPRGGEDFRDFGYRHIWRLANAHVGRGTLPRYGTHLRFAPDGRRLVAAGDAESERLLSFDVSAAAGDRGGALGPPVALPVLRAMQRVSPDGRWTAGTSYWGLGIQELATGRVVHSMEDTGVRWTAWLPDSRAVVCTLTLASGDARAVVIDVPEGTVRRETRYPAGRLYFAAVSPDSRTVLLPGKGGGVLAWDLTGDEGVPPVRLEAFEGPVDVAEYSPDGRILATLENPGDGVTLWRAGTWERLRSFPGYFHCVAFSPEGSRLAAGGDDRSVRVWDVATGAQEHRFLGHMSGVLSVAFDPSRRLLASTGYDRTVKVWDVSPEGRSAQPRLFEPLATVDSELLGLWVSHDGERLITTDREGLVRTWRVDLLPTPRAVPVERFGPSASHPYVGGAISPDGVWAASFLADGEIRVGRFSRPDGTGIFERWRRLPGTGSRPHSCGFSERATVFAAIDHDLVARAWRREGSGPEPEWRLVREARVPFGGLDVTGSGDGRLVAISQEGRVWLWGLEGPEHAVTFDAHRVAVGSVRFTPDSRRLITSGRDGLARVWDLEGRERGAAPPELSRLLGHLDSVGATAIAPDGRRLATGSHDGTIRLWDLTLFPADGRGIECLVLRGHKGVIRSLAFRPDGRALYSLSAGRNGSPSEIAVWRAATDEEIAARDR